MEQITQPELNTPIDWSETKPSVAVINALADLEDVDPIGLANDKGITLYEHIDPEALDAMVQDNAVVSFDVDDYRVRITGDRLIISRADAPTRVH